MAKTGKTIQIGENQFRLEDLDKDTIIMTGSDRVTTVKMIFSRDEFKSLGKIFYAFAKRKQK